MTTHTAEDSPRLVVSGPGLPPLVLLHDVQASFRCAFKDGVFQVRLEIPA